MPRLKRWSSLSTIMDQRLVSIVLEITAHLKTVVALVAGPGRTAVLGGCATPPTDPAARAEFDETNDPFEPLNREIFDFNLFLTRILLKPVARRLSRRSCRKSARTGLRISSTISNEPVVFVNNVLQGEFQRAADTAAASSSTAVVGRRRHRRSRHIERPRAAERRFRPDAIYLGRPGRALSGAADPRAVQSARRRRHGGRWLHGSVRLCRRRTTMCCSTTRSAGWVPMASTSCRATSRLSTNCSATSIDFYASMRSLGRQHRASELRHGEPGPATVRAWTAFTKTLIAARRPRRRRSRAPRRRNSSSISLGGLDPMRRPDRAGAVSC